MPLSDEARLPPGAPLPRVTDEARATGAVWRSSGAGGWWALGRGWGRGRGSRPQRGARVAAIGWRLVRHFCGKKEISRRPGVALPLLKQTPRLFMYRVGGTRRRSVLAGQEGFQRWPVRLGKHATQSVTHQTPIQTSDADHPTNQTSMSTRL